MNTSIVRNENVINFGIIKDLPDYQAKRDMLKTAGQMMESSFNDFVKASVRYFMDAGNHQVAILNGLMQIAHVSGMEEAKLAAYLKKAIPHKYVEATKNKAGQFGAKKENEAYDAMATETFLRENPQWHKWGKVTKSTAFDEIQYLKAVVTKLHKEKKDVRAFALSLISKDSEYRAAKASR